MYQQFPSLDLANKDLENSLEYLTSWFNSQVSAAKKISNEILRLFERGSREEQLLNLPATIKEENDGLIYRKIPVEFPKDFTLLNCIVLLGINCSKNSEYCGDYEHASVRMTGIKTLTEGGNDFTGICHNIIKKTGGLVLIRAHSVSARTDVYIFPVKYDFCKPIPGAVLS